MVGQADSPREGRTPGAGAWERVVLRDGAEVLIRPLERHDLPVVRAVFERMGEEARYRRFLAPKKRLSEADLAELTDVDHHRHEAVAAVDAESGAAVAVARWMRHREGDEVAEASLAVVDAWQRRGLGGALLDRLVDRAREEGVREFTVVLLTRSRAVRHLFERVGAVRVAARSGDTLELEVTLPFDTEAPRAALRAAAAGHVRG